MMKHVERGSDEGAAKAIDSVRKTTNESRDSAALKAALRAAACPSCPKRVTYDKILFLTDCGKSKLRLPLVKNEEENRNAAGAERIDQRREKFRRRNRPAHESQCGENEIPHPKGRNNQSPDQREQRRIFEGHGRSMNVHEPIRKPAIITRVPGRRTSHRHRITETLRSQPGAFGYKSLDSLLSDRGPDLQCVGVVIDGGEAECPPSQVVGSQPECATVVRVDGHLRN